mmetsp:Transcript_1843/g.2532  ORF Transcript_1843/g.2532 Transcript_1843/m.2532 type:complete len:439 (-) Transcript_1843:3537-4853(-)
MTQSSMKQMQFPRKICLQVILISWLLSQVTGFVNLHPKTEAKSTVDSGISYKPISRVFANTPSKFPLATKDETSSSDRLSGILVLASVPLAWGTYSPVVKYLYQVQPVVPGIVFSSAYYLVASAVLNTLMLSLKSDGSEKVDEEPFPVQGGVELGLYLFIANAMQVVGLETVQAGRAGFLIQLTTIFVPILQAISNRNIKDVSLQTWIACLLAFAGVLIMGLDGKDGDLFSSSNVMEQALSLSHGDLLIISASVLYSFHVVRLGRYARETTPLKLAAAKANAEAVLSVGVVSTCLFLGFGGDQGEEVKTFFSALSSGWIDGSVTLATLEPAIGAVVWTGVVTCAYTIFAQSYGQARVEATEANLLYTIQPLFTALFGFLLLGEMLGPSGILGASLIASAIYIVSRNQTEDSGKHDPKGNSDVLESSLISDLDATVDNQ